ncbi:MAG TPA: hypothetical protein VG168_10815 [Bryobacteraceae bacterium]|nr:hypothetical protein [Bryobacteraceae bacterium]
MEQWLVKMIYENSRLEGPEAEECWYGSRTEALQIVEALSADYPGAQIDLVDADEDRPDHWVVNVWYAEENETCAFVTQAEAREFAKSLASDYSEENSAVPAKEITITGPRGRVEYIVQRDLAIAV